MSGEIELDEKDAEIYEEAQSELQAKLEQARQNFQMAQQSIRSEMSGALNVIRKQYDVPEAYRFTTEDGPPRFVPEEEWKELHPEQAARERGGGHLARGPQPVDPDGEVEPESDTSEEPDEGDTDD